MVAYNKDVDGRELNDEMLRFFAGVSAPPKGGLSLHDDAGWPSAVEATMPRYAVITNATPTANSGVLRFTYFTAKSSTQRTTVTLFSGNTAAGATPTLIRAGVYSVATNGDLTLVASTPNDTALLAATNTEYPKAFSAPWNPVVGARYAFGLLVVSAATMPTVLGAGGAGSFTTGPMFRAPALGTILAGQSDLPSSASAPTQGFANLQYAEFS